MFKDQSIGQSALRVLSQVGPRSQQYTPYADYFELRTTEFVLLTSRLQRAGVALPPQRVLEVGCGMGYSLLLWSALGAEATGIDIPVSLKAARQLHADFPPPRDVTLIEGHGEQIPDSLGGGFDLVMTQYVLEHVRDMGQTIRQANAQVAPGGCAVHILNSLVERHAWYLEYRQSTPVRRRLRDAAEGMGKRKAWRDGLAFTPPHEPRFGDFNTEHAEYRLERWALRLLENGCDIIDYFQTRDVNWVFVTTPVR